MKRNENLVPLSRDHHFGLLCSWKIREGVRKNIIYDRIKKYINYFWQESLSKHFEIEDTVLPEPENESLQFQMQKEHSEIRKLINTVNQSQNPRLLEDFADALSGHIRFEERMYFPHLENHLSDDEMTEIGNKLSLIHQKEQDNYPDQFWK
ncbi:MULTISPECIES: hemerythrin domain-containing protein [Chryseobacterium]|uniref:Hemerythrin domain-containing protein n=1 Tax=Chryseobacterium cucumeris TaxID=1813611 RepID=A0ABX9XBS1_9FLAO|nr:MULTISPECIES: hemerythrin domain-containing protein [Chryseobacterium]MCC3215579.1 hemerythrin domain-containing protein [Chryseobacterium sp. X308]MDH5033812.1 hemerythrin domain-containing protein [Chryseobacterium cucumeris]MDR6462709.1 hemerythrin-like domain-containing protein [Chryseobacterium sediminis]RKE81647.1 hemerythrin HHE cation binding domain-containing protein [Chryseobacterium sp. AG363]ROH94845.1 hemerythrin domain-containing protein [Chryseobacterium cucumeris]